MNGAADEMSPGHVDRAQAQRARRATPRRCRAPSRRARRRRAAGARCGRASAPARSPWSGPCRAEPGQQDARLDLRRGDRQLVARSAAARRRRRCAAAGSRRWRRARRPCSRSGIVDAVDRPAADRLVAVERERAAPAGRRAGPGSSRSSVPALCTSIGAVRRLRPRSPHAVHAQPRARLVEPLDAARPALAPRASVASVSAFAAEAAHLDHRPRRPRRSAASGARPTCRRGRRARRRARRGRDLRRSAGRALMARPRSPARASAP